MEHDRLDAGLSQSMASSHSDRAQAEITDEQPENELGRSWAPREKRKRTRRCQGANSDRDAKSAIGRSARPHKGNTQPDGDGKQQEGKRKHERKRDHR